MLTGIAVALLVLNLVAIGVHWIVLRSRFSSSRILADLRSEVDRLITDLGREADRDVELLEGRIRQLREFIAEADSRILLERRETDKRERARDLERELAVPPPAKAAETNAPRVTDKAERPEPITVYTKPIVRRSENRLDPVIPLSEKVLDMARRGISAEMIAATLAVSLGEVELIIDMNRSSL